MAITSMTMREYFDLKGDKSNEISMTVPFSFKGVPNYLREYSFGNSFASMTIYMKLESNLEKAIEIAKKLNSSNVKQLSGGFYILLQLYALFYPYQILDKILGISFGEGPPPDHGPGHLSTQFSAPDQLGKDQGRV